MDTLISVFLLMKSKYWDSKGKILALSKFKDKKLGVQGSLCNPVSVSPWERDAIDNALIVISTHTSLPSTWTNTSSTISALRKSPHLPAPTPAPPIKTQQDFDLEIRVLLTKTMACCSRVNPVTT